MSPWIEDNLNYCSARLTSVEAGYMSRVQDSGGRERGPGSHLFLILILAALGGSGSSTLSLDTASTSTTVGRGQREINVFL